MRSVKRLIAIVVLVMGVLATSAPAFATTGTEPAQDHVLFYKNNKFCIRFNLWSLSASSPTFCLPLL